MVASLESTSIRQWFEGRLKDKLAKLNGDMSRGIIPQLGREIVQDEFGSELESCSQLLREYVEWSSSIIANNVNAVSRNNEIDRMMRYSDRAKGTISGAEQRNRVRQRSERTARRAKEGMFAIAFPDEYGNNINVVLRDATSSQLRYYAEALRSRGKATLNQASMYESDADEMDRKRFATYGELLDLRADSA